MLEKIKQRLSTIPRWLLLVWGLVGPFLGWMLWELLKDRFFSGLNHWLDETFGPVMSAIAESVLWVVWMAAFGATLLAVWWYAKNENTPALIP